MKRSFFNLESTMRKKAAMDMKSTMKEMEPKSTCDDGDSSMVSLDNDYFAYVACFKGFTSVHIRKYVTSNDKDIPEECRFRPTKDGLTMSAAVWRNLCDNFYNLKKDSYDKVVILGKHLCVSREFQNGQQLFVLQKLFQRQNLSFEFTNHVVLKKEQFSKLSLSSSKITDEVKECLITKSLEFFVYQELEQSRHLLNPCRASNDLQLSLSKSILKSVAIKISELYEKSITDEERFSFDFSPLSRQEKFNNFFELALFQLDFKVIAKDFVLSNKDVDFETELGQEEFFEGLNLNILFKQIEKLYIEEEENLYKNLMNCTK